MKGLKYFPSYIMYNGDMILTITPCLILHYCASLVLLCIADASVFFKYTVFDWRQCDTDSDALFVFRNMPIQNCLLECRIRKRCKAVEFSTIRRECGLLEIDVNIVTGYNTRPCVFIRMSDVEDIISVPSTCQNCSANQFCDIMAGSCEKEMKCEHKWLKAKNSCYVFSSELKHNIEAKRHCTSSDSHLMHIETSYENELINRQMKKNNVLDCWLGLTYHANTREWKFTQTNTVAEFFSWFAGEPNQVGGYEGCAVKLLRGWYDVGCGGRAQFICEKSL